MILSRGAVQETNGDVPNLVFRHRHTSWRNKLGRSVLNQHVRMATPASATTERRRFMLDGDLEHFGEHAGLLCYERAEPPMERV